MAKQYLFNSTPTIINIFKGLQHAYNGWIDPETPYQTGVAPTVGFGKSALAKTSLTKKATAEFKHSKANATNDFRSTNPGRPRSNRFQYMEEMLGKYPQHAKYISNYKKKMATLSDQNRIAQLQKEYKEYIKRNAQLLGY